MSCLAPCPACARHIANDETTCPFCVAAVPDSFREANACRKVPPGRLSRAARLAAGAALIGVQAAACAGSAYGTSPPYDAAVADTSTVDGNTNDSAVALYGAAPAPLEQAPPAGDDTSPPKPRGK